MKNLTTLLLLAALLIAPISYASSELLFFKHNGQQHSYLIHLPSSYNNDQSVPLLMVLHGRNGNAKRISESTGFSKRADQHGFIAVYPTGTNQQWNYLYGIPGAPDGSDDPGFLLALTDAVINTYNVDRKRLYVTGISNGGFMAQRLACDQSDQYSGFASVAAGAYAVLSGNCNRSAPINALYIHGTEDRLVPWEGLGIRDESGSEQLVTMSIKSSLKFWAEHNQCSPKVDVKDLSSTGESSKTRVRVLNSNSCPSPSKVTLYAIIGGGHNWPGVQSAIPPSIAGQVNMDIHASDEILSIFNLTTSER
ncbi:MAG: polyhydroxybutyrate depolymerase [Gammaproteobacteria bacterium]|jgi:polyhydroxybutyrate depolymerase